MKALRQRLQQPEAFIRQVITSHHIAELHKSGPFANHYSLTDQYRETEGADAKEAAAAEIDDDDEDEPEEMEDVLPTG